MKNTAYTIYKQICKELNILFPLKESEISIRKNPIPNNLEFHEKGISKKELSDNMNDISICYYKIFKYLGEEKFYNLQESIDIFSENCREYPDRNINISTVISILYLSGFRDNELYNRSLKFIIKK